MDALFGREFSVPMKFFIAFAVVLLLIGAATYLVRRFGAGGLAVTTQRNRQPRLAVVDSTAIDNRRKLVIVRRDNTEHLLLIGGPTDVLVEANIVRGATQTVRDTPVRTAVAEPAPAVPALDDGWPLAPAAEPMPRGEPVARIEPAPRPEPIPRAEPAPRMEPAPKPEPVTRAEPIIKPAGPILPAAPVLPMFAPPAPPPTITPVATATASETPVVAARAPDPVPEVQIGLAAALQAPEPAQPVAPPPAAPPVEALAPPEPPAPPPPPVATPEEQNLTEMAQRLEAALRRPATPVAAPPRPLPPLPAAAPAAAAPRPRPAAPPAAAPAPAAPAPRPATSYESLQREMANLLGRQSGSS